MLDFSRFSKRRKWQKASQMLLLFALSPWSNPGGFFSRSYAPLSLPAWTAGTAQGVFLDPYHMLLMRKMLVAIFSTAAKQQRCFVCGSALMSIAAWGMRSCSSSRCVDAVGIFASRINAVNLPVSAACGAYWERIPTRKAHTIRLELFFCHLVLPPKSCATQLYVYLHVLTINHKVLTSLHEDFKIQFVPRIQRIPCDFSSFCLYPLVN